MEFLASIPVGWVAAIALAVMMLLLLTGIPIAFALVMAGVLTLALFTKFNPGDIVGLTAWNRTNSFILVALPMFILTGEILVHSRLSKWLFDGIAPWVVILPGRLLHTNVLGCSMFAAVSGSSTATTLTIGKVTYTELHRRGYDDALSVGSLAGAGTLGLLIPPSMSMILYGFLVGESVGQLFMAGVFPGLLITLLYGMWIVFRVKINPWVVPKIVEPYTWGDRWKGLILMSPVVSLMVLILGSIYTGVATPTEAAAMGVAAALFLALVTRSLNRSQFIDALVATCRTTSFVTLVVVAASIFGLALAYLRIPAVLAEGVTSLSSNTNVVLVLLAVVYIVLGMFLDGFSIMIMTLPVVLPLLDSLQIDRVLVCSVLGDHDRTGQYHTSRGI